MTARFANNTLEATHRYPTSLHWGQGYFNDGMKYLVSDGDDEAFAFIKVRYPTLTIANVQKKVDDTWVWIAN